MSSSRDTKAFLVAIPTAATTAALTIVTYIAIHEQLSPFTIAGAIAGYFAYSVFFVSIAGLLVGAPIVWALRRLGLLNFPILATAGIISGAAVSWLILSGGRNREAILLLIGALPGLAASITWWLIAERRTELDA